MAKRTGSQPPERPALRLRVSIEDARSRLADRAEKGQKLKEIPINSWESLDAAKKEFSKWSSYNRELLKQLFTSDQLSDEYARYFGGVLSMGRNLGRDIREFHEDVDDKVHRLESIAERLELIPLSDDVTVRLEASASVPASTTRVFVVHGHDEAIREGVARFLERLELEPVILHEQANEGMTVIEKLERHSDVRFAVVLLTPDDEGRSVAVDGLLLPRARQNVVLELGYFTAKLGRKAVCALHRGSLELPSDYLGVVYVPIDEGGGWHLRLAKELKAAGFPVDMNKAL
jgi:predicted nucleotide-binding protein